MAVIMVKMNLKGKEQAFRPTALQSCGFLVEQRFNKYDTSCRIGGDKFQREREKIMR